METIRAGIKTLLTGTTGIGQIWDHRRILDDPESFDGVFVSSAIVNCWQFYSTEIQEESGGVGAVEDRIFAWTIEGWYQFTDNATLASSSDYTFDVLVEAICTKFRDNYRIGGVTNENGPPTNIRKDIVMQGSVRCHHVVMDLAVTKIGL
jgi:hypothetical protein